MRYPFSPGSCDSLSIQPFQLVSHLCVHGSTICFTSNSGLCEYCLQAHISHFSLLPQHVCVWGPLFAHVSPPLGHRVSACLCEYCLVLMQAAGIFLFLVFQLVWKPGAAMSLTSTWCCVGEESPLLMRDYFYMIVLYLCKMQQLSLVPRLSPAPFS